VVKDQKCFALSFLEEISEQVKKNDFNLHLLGIFDILRILILNL